ncbi:MAG: NYN domain-containing protein [Phycisphaerales bacterium]
MPILVDTYNVLHVTGVLPPDLAGLETADLVELLPRTRFAGESVTLVCDGKPGPNHPAARGAGTVRVRYSGPGVTADELIAQLVDQSSAPRRLTIVSSDRAVQQAARRRRCIVLSSEAFLKRITDDLAGIDPRIPTIARHSPSRQPGRRPDETPEGNPEGKPGPPPRPPNAAPNEPHPPPAGDDPAAPGGYSPLLPADLIREAASMIHDFNEDPPIPAPSASDRHEPGAPSTPAEPSTPAARLASAGQPARKQDAAPGRTTEAAPSPPEPDEPMLPSSLIAEAMAMETDEEIVRRNRVAAGVARDAEERMIDASRAAEAAARASDIALRAQKRAEATRERDEKLLRAAEAAIGSEDIDRLELLARGDEAEPSPQPLANHGLLPEELIADAERMLREIRSHSDLRPEQRPDAPRGESPGA